MLGPVNVPCAPPSRAPIRSISASFSLRGARSLVASLAVAAALLSGGAPAAAAGPSDKQEAKQLVSTGQMAMKNQRFAEAVTAFERADSLDPSAATKVEIGRAYMAQGKLVAASKALHAAQDAAKGVPAARKSGDQAKKLLDELEKRIPWIQLVVNGPTKPAKTFIDGQEVDASSELPYDAGEHVVAAEAEGFAREEQRVSLVEGAHAKLTLEMKKDASAPAEGVAAGGGSSGKGSVIPAVIGFGVGAVGLALGTALGVMAFGEKGKADDAKAGYSRCVANSACTLRTALAYKNDFNTALDTSKTDGTISTVGFIIGGVGVAAGVTFLFWRPWGGGAAATEKPAGAVTVTPTVGIGHVGLTGTF
jgi:tetratricopeptide (TPR) repeat protein